MAPRSAAAAAGAAAPPPPGLLARAVAWIKGHAQWALYNAVGAVLAIPLALKLGLGLLLRCVGALAGALAGARWPAGPPPTHLPRSALPLPERPLRLPPRPCCSPRGMLYRKDRSALALPDPLPGLSHEWVETVPGVT